MTAQESVSASEFAAERAKVFVLESELRRQSELEARLVEAERLIADAVEQLRVTRWHATRDAALPQAMINWANECELDIASALGEATEVADRAHGPLEAKP